MLAKRNIACLTLVRIVSLVQEQCFIQQYSFIYVKYAVLEFDVIEQLTVTVTINILLCDIQVKLLL